MKSCLIAKKQTFGCSLFKKARIRVIKLTVLIKKKRRFSIDFSNPFLNVFRKNGLAKFHFFKFYNKPSKCSSSKSFLNLGLCKFQKFVKKFLNIQSMIVDRRKDKN